ncbi:MAG: DUF4147 domain-containing protein [Pseudomonadota bacterium]
MIEARQQLVRYYHAALQAVAGRRCVAQALAKTRVSDPVYVLAVGKAAASMMQGALDVLGERIIEGLVITKYHHVQPFLQADARILCLEAGHPTPDANSLRAGEMLHDFFARTPDHAFFLILLSGGASALVERLPHGLGLPELVRLNQWLLGSGLPIAQINRIRKAVSSLKGGRALRELRARAGRCLLISDVPGDDPAVIGSGLFYPPKDSAPLPDDLPSWVRAMIDRAANELAASEGGAVIEHTLIASNRQALDAVAERAAGQGLVVHRHELLVGDALDAGARIAEEMLHGAPGVYLWGGETTVVLPEHPGRGGRCQSLALAAALRWAGKDGLYLLAGGTDGSDGPGEDAGALVDGRTIAEGELGGLSAVKCLQGADARRFLDASGDLLSTGPTGTNVMDVIIGIKRGNTLN